MLRTLFFLCISLILATTAFAQTELTANTLKLDDPANMPPASIEDLAWMAGYWQGEFNGGEAEEIWAVPSGGTMVGMFKVVRDDTTSMYEIMTLVEEGGSVVLKLKHFNPDLSGWEEKDGFVAFPLVRLADNAAYFEGLTFELISRDTLQGYLAIHRRDSIVEAPFTYRRAQQDGTAEAGSQ